jgi:hypothetical protein
MRRLVTLLAALSLLALPAAGLAQSAGDEQYEDPFGEVEEPSGSQGNPEPAPQPEPAPAQNNDSLGTSEPEVTEQTGAPTLPATGLPAGLLAGTGALLLAAGTTLRRRVS